MLKLCREHLFFVYIVYAVHCDTTVAAETN